jgi:hypothetical protein
LLLSIKKRWAFLLEERANSDHEAKVKINKPDRIMIHLTEMTSALEK